MSSVLTAVVLRLAWLGLQAGAPAEQPPSPAPHLALTWQAPPACPDEAAFVALLEELVGSTLHRSPRASLRAAVVLRQSSANVSAPRWVAEVELAVGSAVEHRQITASECGTLVQGASVTVATHVLSHPDEAHSELPPMPGSTPPATLPGATAGSVAPALPEVPTLPETPARAGSSPAGMPPPSPASRSAAVTQRQARGDATPAEARISTGAPTDVAPPSAPGLPRPRVHAAVFGGAAVGLGPGTSGLVGGAVGLGGRGFRVEAVLAHRVATASTPVFGANVRASLTWGGLLGCGVPRVRAWSFPLCAGVAAGVSAGRGRGALLNGGALVPQAWVGLPWRGGVRWTVARHVALALDAMGVWSAVSPIFVAGGPDGLTTLFQQQSPISGVFTAGVEFQWF